MTITVADLRRITQVLLAEVASKGLAVEIDSDFYWDVPSEARYDNYNEPTSLVVGQLTENWDELRRILSGDSEPLPYALVWLAAILRRVGEQLIA
jgi:hypothetical protein